MTDFIAQLRGQLFTQFCRYFRKNICIGRGLKIYKKLSVNGEGRVFIGDNCIIKGMLGDDSQYACLSTHSDKSEIIIGNNAKLYAARLFSKFSINIGNDLHIEESGISDTDFHSIDTSRGEASDENLNKCKILIGNSVYIGAKSFISKGVRIGDGAIVWPGSIVSAPVPPGASVCGNPARPIKQELSA